jgi:glutaminase
MSVLRKPPVFGLVVAVLAATAAAWAFQPDRPSGYVSTGQLPQAERVKALVDEAYAKFKTNTEGKNADYIPALAKVPSNLFGICVVNVGGAVYSVGDVDAQFSIQSVSKPFVFALVCQAYGDEEARKKVGVNATGLPFNSLLAIEQNKNRTVNPLVNAGAIAAASFVPGANAEEKWKAIRTGLSDFAGRELSLNEEVYQSEAATNQRNQSIARLLKAYERITFDPDQATDVYTKQCSLNVTAKDLAVMGATLANGGINPLTKKRVIDAVHCQHVLAVMATAGLYETSGDWLYDIGMPGKSGVGGGIVCISPGKGGLGTLAPPLDAAGNSVKGQLVAKHLSEQLGLNIFASTPASQR